MGAGNFVSAAAFGTAAVDVEAFAAGAAGAGFGGAAGVADGGVEGCTIGAVLSCCPAAAATATGGTAAAAPRDGFGIAASGLEAEAGATFGAGTPSGLRAGSCSPPSTVWDSPAAMRPALVHHDLDIGDFESGFVVAHSGVSRSVAHCGAVDTRYPAHPLFHFVHGQYRQQVVHFKKRWFSSHFLNGYIPDGNVSGTSPSIHTGPTSSGSTALVSSMCMTASCCCARRV